MGVAAGLVRGLLGYTPPMEYAVSESGGNHLCFPEHVMELTPEVIRGVARMSTRTRNDLGDHSMAGIGSIAALVHEAVHVHLLVEMRNGNRVVTSLRLRGIEYYRGASLRSGGVVENDFNKLWGVFDEAAAGYVAHRVQIFLMAMHELDRIEAEVRAGRMKYDDAIQAIADREASFNLQMKLRVFGYQQGDGRIDFIARPISKEIKAYCDNVLLGGAIAESFRGTERIRQRLAAVQAAIDASKQDSPANPQVEEGVTP